MEFLKKHYEKVLLGVVLLGLTVGAALLPWMISSERDAERAKAAEIINRPVKPLDAPNVSRAEKALQQVATPTSLDFSTENKLFNSVPWQKTPDGRWIKITRGNEIGVEAVAVTKITPLYTTFTLDSVMTGEAGARYMIVVVREAAPRPGDRGRKMTGATLNEKNKEGFIIREVKGPPAEPTDLVLELTDTGERGSLSKNKPFKRVEGYMADLKYPPDNRTWSNQRIGSRIRIASEDYNLVYIGTNEVVLSALSGKKTSRPFNPGP